MLLDVSQQMATPVAPGGPTLEQVLGQAATLGLAQFPDSTQMGDWAFASHLDGNLPYKQLVSVGPLPAPLGLITRRQQVAALAKCGYVRPLPRGPIRLDPGRLQGDDQQLPGPLRQRGAGHDGRGGQRPGRHLRPGPDQAAAHALQPQAAGRDHRHQVRQRGDFNTLQQIAGATGGQAYDITNPTQISKVFFSAIARRLCSPNCGT